MNTQEGVQALLARAEAARDAGLLNEGLLAARDAFEQAGDADHKRRAGVLLVHFQYRSGALAGLVNTGLDLLPLLRAAGPSAELFDILRTVSLAGCEVGRFDVALPCAQEAQAQASQLGDRGRLALAVNAVACCFERMGDPWQAERLMRDALDIARQHGEEHPIFVTLNNLSAALIGMYHQLRDAAPAEEARDTLRRALPIAREATALSAGPDKVFYRVFTEGNLGEVLLHLGRFAEARPLLETSLAQARQIGADAQAARIGCSLGELELFEGRAEVAWQRLEAVRLAAIGTDLRTIQLRLHHALWRAARAMQRSSAALHHLETYLQLERHRSVSQLRAQSELLVTRAEVEQVRMEARRDPLTRLGNRREVDDRWPVLLANCQASGMPLAVAMLDLDLFKQINDRFGHAIGDDVLVAIARLLRENTRAADIVARVGGEEFLLVLPDSDSNRALEICERLRQRVAAHAWGELADGLAVTLSIGLTGTPPYDADLLAARADAALYNAKAEGRNRVVMSGN
ncbi:MAG: tetratricopeptide repeat-containing diguanylate cyclase [Burkholderiaceae bacterium]